MTPINAAVNKPSRSTRRLMVCSALGIAALLVAGAGWKKRLFPAPRVIIRQVGIEAATFSPTGKVIAAFADGEGSGKPQRLSVWNVADGTLAWSIIAHRYGGINLAFSSDGRYIATIGQETPPPRVLQGKLIAVPPMSATKIWDAQSGSLVHNLGMSKDWCPGVLRFSADNRTLWAMGRGARAWDSASGRLLKQWRFPGKIWQREEKFSEALALSQDGSLLAVRTPVRTIVIKQAGSRRTAGLEDVGGEVQVWSIAHSKLLRSFPERQANGANFSQDGRTLAFTYHSSEPEMEGRGTFFFIVSLSTIFKKTEGYGLRR